MKQKNIYVINYWLKNAEGEVVDTSEGGQPMSFLEGSNQVIQGIQKAVIGRQIGDRIEATIPPQLAYGERLPELISKMHVSGFEGVDDVLVGMKFQTNTGGDAKVVKVVAVDKEYVTVDANHPLAGLTLVFELEVLDIKPADEADVILQSEAGQG